MRRWLLLTTAAFALAGCKATDRDRKTADPVSRPKPKNWDDGPTPPLDRVGTPGADSWADPKDPSYDLDRETRGVLAGFVEDPDGRKVRDAFIEVELVDGPGTAGAPVGVQTDRQGNFLIKGLKPRKTYRLTVQTKLDGRDFAAEFLTQTGKDRSMSLRISLQEGLTLPGRPAPSGPGRDRPDLSPPAGPAPQPGGSSRPPETNIPAPVLPSASTGTRPDPVGGTGLGLPPASPGGVVRPDSDAFPPAAPPVGRPDLTTRTEDQLGRPPAASIPPPAPPTVTPPPGGPGRSQSRTVRPANEFTLVDTIGVPMTFPTGRAGSLVLLDFMTTTCPPCKKAIPDLKDLQARYGTRGLDVVGVTCDTVGVAERRALASRYQRDNGLNYQLYVEPGPEPGAVMKRFGVTAYPTLVLLDGFGKVLWTGHPSNADKLERVVQQALSGQ